MGYKILIVDDEPLIRQGIKIKLNNNKLNIDVVEEADDGIDALNKLKTFNADIIITDVRMPEMDGLEMIHKVRELNYNSEFIIISGYQEFQYAKKAIDFGVKDYILKPIDSDELEKTLLKVMKGIYNKGLNEKRISNLEEEIEKVKIEEVYKELFSILNEDYTKDEIQPKLSKININFRKKYFITSILCFKNADFTSEKIENSNLKINIRNIINNNDVIFFKNYSKDNEIIFIFNEDDIKYDFIKFKLQECIEYFNENLDISSAAGIGEAVLNINEIKKSYAHAKYSINERLIKGYNKVFVFDKLIKENKNINYYIFKREIFLTYLEDGNALEAARYIENIFNILILNNDFSYSYAKKICVDIYICISDFLINSNNNIDIIFKDMEQFLEDIYECDTREDVFNYIKNLICSIVGNFDNNSKYTGEDIVIKVKNYIDNHYKENISLNSISKKYFINSNYFSRIFKEIVGKSFNDYITNVRMAKAYELIKNTDISISNISNLVGYGDPKYFSKVFKKEMDISPSECIKKERKKLMSM